MDQMIEQIEIFLVTALIASTTCLIAWRKGFFRYFYPEERGKPKLRLRDLVGAFAIFLALQVLIIPALAVIFVYLKTGNLKALQSNPTVQGWANVFAILTSAAAILFYSCYMIPHSWKLIWRDDAFAGIKKIVKDFLFGIASWIVCYPVVVALGQLVSIILLFVFEVKPVDQVAVKYLKMAAVDPLLFWVMALVISFIVPIIEEILFRGFLQTWLKERFGRNLAIMIASIIFSMFHFSMTQGLNNLQIISVLFVLSCFLGFIYERQNSLVAPIGMHVFFNVASVTLLVFDV